ncbi:hypothetical protein GCM10009636_13890 [Arthrobacter koreensis]|uniref:Uncharacterized protein n=1 Tax=Arthrobacter koreensis TaxID=199136 RepID=A0ABY6FVK7_9MICC|nr:hypothetical protein [Arthrobacter koreensis]MEB7447561.1 hypothetical protein [Arthrobacter koreensis]UYB37264.1 hypothetical protein N9A08_06350 [Arthrobacter koreensis]
MEERAETGGDSPKPELTGDPAVDEVLSGLSDIAETPVGDHAALYAGLHDGLLAALNEEPGQSRGSVPGAGSTGVTPTAAPLPGQGPA